MSSHSDNLQYIATHYGARMSGVSEGWLKDAAKYLAELEAENARLSAQIPVWVHVHLQLPPDSVEVPGFHPDWVDDDFNPTGIRMCFQNDGERWFSAKWCDNQDTYENGEDNQAPVMWLDRFPPSTAANVMPLPPAASTSEGERG